MLAGVAEDDLRSEASCTHCWAVCLPSSVAVGSSLRDALLTLKPTLSPGRAALRASQRISAGLRWPPGRCRNTSLCSAVALWTSHRGRREPCRLDQRAGAPALWVCWHGRLCRRLCSLSQGVFPVGSSMLSLSPPDWQKRRCVRL